MKRTKKRTAIIGMALALALVVLGCASEQQAGKEGSPAPMTMHDITVMSKAGISDSVIVTMITTTSSRFNLKAADVIALSDSGVSHNVLNAMIKTSDTSKQSERQSAVYAYPWYPYYVYDPFWYPWYYPTYSIGFGIRSHGFHAGFGHGGGRHR